MALRIICQVGQRLGKNKFNTRQLADVSVSARSALRNQYIECWEYSCCCCYVTISPLPPHYQLVGTPNASLSHSPQTVGLHATCHLLTTTCQLPPANFQLKEIIFFARKKNSVRNFFPPEIVFCQKTQKWAEGSLRCTQRLQPCAGAKKKLPVGRQFFE